jgi:hypothetical protein
MPFKPYGGLAGLHEGVVGRMPTFVSLESRVASKSMFRADFQFNTMFGINSVTPMNSNWKHLAPEPDRGD